MKLKDIMSLNARTVSPETRIQEAASIMESANVGFLPVVEDDKVVGVVTDRDMVVRGLSRAKQPGKVGEVMTARPITASPNDDFQQAMKLMREHRVGRLCVVDSDSCLQGVVSLNDLARAKEHDPKVGDLALVLGDAHKPNVHGGTPARR